LICCCIQSKILNCIQRDDLNSIFGKLEDAAGIIFGGVNYNGRVNSSAFLFMERMFPLYHHLPTLKNMPVAVVAVGEEAPEHDGMVC
jgi:multimeric flavodoxin WrbA